MKPPKQQENSECCENCRNGNCPSRENGKRVCPCHAPSKEEEKKCDCFDTIYTGVSNLHPTKHKDGCPSTPPQEEKRTFSDFIRKGTPEEKQKVYKEVIQESIEDQLAHPEACEERFDENFKNKYLTFSTTCEIKQFIRSELQSAREEEREKIRQMLERMRRKHREFECNGTRKYENWCEEENCPSQDAIEIKNHNSALDQVLSILRK